MGKISIASSRRFYDQAKRAAEIFSANGYKTNTPAFEYDGEVGPFVKHKLTRRFLDGIPGSCMLYVVAEEGYVGVSVAMEIGYADALKIPICASDWPEDDAALALVETVCSVCDLDMLLKSGPVGK